MSRTIVEVQDQYGGYIRAQKNIVTGFIHITIYNGQTGNTDKYVMDPKNPKVIKWLKSVYQPIHLDILLRGEVLH